MPNAESLIPEVTDDDIAWVSSLLGLDTLDESRRAFLKCRTTIDLSACPGSGKTTLIVAKLAILARKWPHRTKGLCILSHTNVAREQIEHRLGRTVVGQRLLGYPHFIDTIHGFVNRFLALPWLLSKGFPPLTIDNDITTAYRRAVLGNRDYWTVQGYLQKKFIDFDRLRICARDFSFDLGGKPFPAKTNAKSYQLAKKAVEESAAAGYFCHEEMFVWANALLEDHPNLPDWLVHRFPLMILDEMQDTSEQQRLFLSQIFLRNSGTRIVQRVGDPNQEIFDSPELGDGSAESFPDPDVERCLEIPDSYRFGLRLAEIASPFAVRPVCPNGLCGMGPIGEGVIGAECPHAIFVFPDDNTQGVLNAYGEYVLSVLDNDLARAGAVTAVGHRHQDEPGVGPGHSHYPKTVGHYWAGYNVQVVRKDSHPRTMLQYVRLAQACVHDGRILAPGVEKLASGILELARRMGDIGDLKRKTRSHLTLTEVFRTNLDTLETYNGLVKELIIDGKALSEDSWPSLYDRFVSLARSLCSADADVSRAEKFLQWSAEEVPQLDTFASRNDPGLNIYRVSDSNGAIDIRLGSIHSVKGQTHVATLLLSTFWNGHSAKRMMPWLLGHKENGTGVGKQDRQRLLHTYVAMTRPSHLLCLAVPQSALGKGRLEEQNIQILSSKGWHIANIVNGHKEWIN
ncbi:MAG: UvrD-helicase domain-containing protein [Desulfovermiculus sp.]|nr:UvrD-helicase domain-containing protein [Desulfovermiculus sp.]